MKLKLETQDGVTVLSAHEDVAAAQVPVLRAGIQKLFGSGSKRLILDLTALATIDQAAQDALKAMCAQLASSDGVFLIAAPAPLGQCPTREQAVQQISSEAGALLATEAQLRAKLASIESQKAALTQKLGSLGVSDEEYRKLRSENSELKQVIPQLERELNQLVSKRKPSTLTEGLLTRHQSIQSTLQSILQQDGILPVR